jgi:hypothetical protein
MLVLLNPTVQERLRQGATEPLIAGLLECTTVAELRDYLFPRTDAALVETINRYLKRIVVKHVNLASFKPSVSMIQHDKIPQIVQEFQAYLEAQLGDIEHDDDTLPILQVE